MFLWFHTWSYILILWRQRLFLFEFKFGFCMIWLSFEIFLEFSVFFFSKRNFVEFYWVCGGGGDSTQTNTHTGQQKKKKKHWVGVVNCCKNFFFFSFSHASIIIWKWIPKSGGRETHKGWINQNRSACVHWHHLWFTTGTFLKMITGSWFLSTTVTFLPPPAAALTDPCRIWPLSGKEAVVQVHAAVSNMELSEVMNPTLTQRSQIINLG